MAQSSAGSELLLFVDDVNVGFVTDVSVGQNLAVQQIEAFGDDLPQELRATGMTTTVSFGHVNIINQPLSTTAIFPRALSGNIVAFEPKDLILVEKATGTVRWRITQCMPTMRGFQVGARSLAAENVSWACRAALEGEDA